MEDRVLGFQSGGELPTPRRYMKRCAQSRLTDRCFARRFLSVEVNRVDLLKIENLRIFAINSVWCTPSRGFASELHLLGVFSSLTIFFFPKFASLGGDHLIGCMEVKDASFKGCRH